MRSDVTIDVVRGRLDTATSDEVRALWERHGALRGEAAQRRLPELCCVLRSGDGAVVGVNSVTSSPVELVGGRTFWMYRRFLDPAIAADGHDAAMINAAFDTLAPGHEPGDGGPVGLCVMVEDPALLRARPEAVWAETQLVYAGYTPAGQQLRIRYFEGALIA